MSTSMFQRLCLVLGIALVCAAFWIGSTLSHEATILESPPGACATIQSC